MAHEIADWNGGPDTDFYIPPNSLSHLPNVYVEGQGYLTEHVPRHDWRNDPDHWDGLFENSEAFRGSWQPRPGPLQLVDTLAQQKRDREGTDAVLDVVSLGAGLGDFTADLASIPGTHVLHVDFSSQANSVAQRHADAVGVNDPTRLAIVTADNGTFLEGRIAAGKPADVVFYYGGLGENTPSEGDIERMVSLGSEVLAPGGHLWYVGLQNEFLLPPKKRPREPLTPDQRYPADILGEYPTRPGVVQRAVLATPEMTIVRDEHGARPDSHPIQRGGPSIPHLHDVQRFVAAKSIDGVPPATPDFGFKNAIGSNWPRRWQQITATRG